MFLLSATIILLVLILTLVFFFTIERSIILFINYVFITGIYIISFLFFNHWRKTRQNMVMELLALTGGKFFLTIAYLFVLNLFTEPTMLSVLHIFLYYVMMLIIEVIYFKKKLNS